MEKKPKGKDRKEFGKGGRALERVKQFRKARGLEPVEQEKAVEESGAKSPRRKKPKK